MVLSWPRPEAVTYSSYPEKAPPTQRSERSKRKQACGSGPAASSAAGSTPQSGRTMVYIAARPTHGTDAFVGDTQELAEVRWVTLAQADELMDGRVDGV